MGNETSITLLHKLKERDDQLAWNRFFAVYAPVIRAYARSRGCTPAMTEDVLQESLVCLARHLPRFEYDPRRGKFRTWLYTVVLNRVRDARRRQRWLASLDAEPEEGGCPEPADPNSIEPDARWEREWRLALLARALDEVQQRVDARTFACFRLYVLEDRPVPDVTRELGLNANTVYQQKNRITRLLREIVAQLEAEGEL